MCSHKTKIKKDDGRIFFVNCGKCSACQQAKANRIAAKIESNKIKDGNHINLFITLTYANEFLPYIKRDDLLQVVDSFSEGYRRNYIPVYRDYKVRRSRSKNFLSSTETFMQNYWSEGYQLHNGIMYSDKVYEDGSQIDYFTLPPDFVEGDVDILKHIDELPNYRVCTFENGKKEWIPNVEDKIGVCLMSDMQNFWNRFDKNLKRKYNYYGEYSRFSTFEYGEVTFRPHIHAVLQIEADAYAKVYQAIIDSWKYSDYDRLSRGIEIEKHASSYVASYLVKSTDCPYLFTHSVFKPRYSFSHHAGLARPEFSLSSLVARIKARDLHYYKQVRKNGVLTTVRSLLPISVISYYFPKIKGFNKLSSDELARIYASPETELRRYARRLGYDSKYYSYDESGLRLSWNFNERYCHFMTDDNIFLRDDYINCEWIAHKSHDLKVNLGILKAALNRIDAYTLLNLPRDYTSDYLNVYLTARELYGQLAATVWTVYQSNALKDSFEGDLANDLNTPDKRYINYCDFLYKPNIAPTLIDLVDIDHDRKIFTNYNCSAYDLIQDSVLHEKRAKYIQKKQANHYLHEYI